MTYLKTISWSKINEYLEKGLLISQKHPIKDLWILNYSKTCQFEKAWDLVSLSCRGLVINKEGNIVSKCIPKFFNWEELELEAYYNNPFIGKIPNEPFEVFEKMDGSYIVLFYYDNEWIFASRGSFTSEQSFLAKEIFNEKYKNKVLLNNNYNYIMELIGNDNKIVVSYPENDLVLLTCFSKESNDEISIYSDEFKGFNKVKKYDDLNDYKVLKEIVPDNAEGFVVKFKSGKRMKIKGSEYTRLHAIVTNVSNKTIWEDLKENRPLEELLTNVPDEFFSWVDNTRKQLQEAYNEIEKRALSEYIYVIQNFCLKDMHLMSRIELKKNFAMGVKDIIEKHSSKNSGILFNIFDNKDYKDIIWKMIKPKYEKPFHNLIEDDS